MARRHTRPASLAHVSARHGRRGAWQLTAALLCAHGCFMEGYERELDAGSADTAAQGEPPSSVGGNTRDAADAPDGAGVPDGGAREPVGDGAGTPAMDGGATRVDSGHDGSADDAAGNGGGSEMGGAVADAAPIDASDGATLDTDARRDAAIVSDSGSACSGANTCSPQCNASPCALDCADAGTCSVTCRAGQTCNIDCANAGTCSVVCQAGAVCNTQCTNIQFCPVDCQPGANCRNTCATGAQCGFTPFCTQGYKGCGQIGACGDDAGC